MASDRGPVAGRSVHEGAGAGVREEMVSDVSVDISGRVQQRHALPSPAAPAAGRSPRSGAVPRVDAPATDPAGSSDSRQEAEGKPRFGAVAAEELPAISRSLLAKTTELLNEMLEESRRRLKFNVHEATGRIWVQVIDTQTQEVIKEIPPERYLDLVARIWELVGILVDEKA